MSAMTSQITGVSIVCSTVCSGANRRKSSPSLAFVGGGGGGGNPPVTDGFPSQRASNMENVSFDDVIIMELKLGLPSDRITVKFCKVS